MDSRGVLRCGKKTEFLRENPEIGTGRAAFAGAPAGPAGAMPLTSCYASESEGHFRRPGKQVPGRSAPTKEKARRSGPLSCAHRLDAPRQSRQLAACGIAVEYTDACAPHDVRLRL